MPEYIIQITIEQPLPGTEYGMLFALTNKGRIFYRATHPESDWMEMRTPLELGGFRCE
jgi:hypothetical protein